MHFSVLYQNLRDWLIIPQRKSIDPSIKTLSNQIIFFCGYGCLLQCYMVTAHCIVAVVWQQLFHGGHIVISPWPLLPLAILHPRITVHFLAGIQQILVDTQRGRQCVTQTAPQPNTETRNGLRHELREREALRESVPRPRDQRKALTPRSGRQSIYLRKPETFWPRFVILNLSVKDHRWVGGPESSQGENISEVEMKNQSERVLGSSGWYRSRGNMAAYITGNNFRPSNEIIQTGMKNGRRRMKDVKWKIKPSLETSS